MTTPALTLVTLGGAFGLRNVSPFCLKIEMLLENLGIPYELEEQPDPRKAPKGKLPYLIADGQKIPDSELIVQYLDELTQGSVYAGLDDAQRAHGVALTRLVEDHLYWIMVASRWLDDAWYPNVVRDFFDIAPAMVRPLVAGLARRQVRQTYRFHGLGRHSLKEQAEFAERDLAALENAVSEQDFLFGATPNVFDFTIAGFMAGLYDQNPGTWLNPLAEACPKLKAYTERVQTSTGIYARGVAA